LNKFGIYFRLILCWNYTASSDSFHGGQGWVLQLAHK
jgi:hypothetical protein